MKKILTLVAVSLATTALIPEASALPVFSRQVGRGCSACHFQHFPLLNSYGRDFKASGYTLTGAQRKVKDDHLSIPNVLNLGVLTTTRYDNVSTPAGMVAPPKWNVPGNAGELSIFFGGRIADFAGFLAEMGTGGGAAAVGAAKLAMLFPVGNFRVGPVVVTSDGQGIAHSFEIMNTGAANTHKLSTYNGTAATGSGFVGNGNHVAVTSAAQYFGTNTAATGIALVGVNTSMGYINLAKYEAAGLAAGGAGSLPLSYARIAGLFGVGDWDVGVGLQNWSGTSLAPAIPAALPVTPMDYKATVIDGQMQGELAGMPFGLYASYGRAPAVTPTALTGGNAFNFNAANGVATTSAATSFNIAAELGVIPRGTLQLAFRSAKMGAAPGVTGLNDNAVMFAGTYELAQNVELSLTHTRNSGSAWGGLATSAYGAAPMGKTETTFMLEALF